MWFIHSTPVKNETEQDINRKSTKASHKMSASVDSFFFLIYLRYYFFRFSFMLAAALRPSPIARITVAPPRTMSPPA